LRVYQYPRVNPTRPVTGGSGRVGSSFSRRVWSGQIKFSTGTGIPLLPASSYVVTVDSLYHIPDRQRRSLWEGDRLGRPAHTTVHNYNDTQYYSIETVLLISHFFQTDITSKMWPQHRVRMLRSTFMHSSTRVISNYSAL